MTRDFALMVDPYGSSSVGDPDELMVKFTTGGSPNWGRFSEPLADQLYDQQKTARDEEKRLRLVKEMQKRILEDA